MLVDPKSVKKIENLTVSFTLLGSASLKAVQIKLMKLSPGFNFINILHVGITLIPDTLWKGGRVGAGRQIAFNCHMGGGILTKMI